MQLIAKVYNAEILENDVLRECRSILPEADSFDLSKKKSALARLIDRALLLHEATIMGINASEEEYDNLLLDVLEREYHEMNPEEQNDKAARGLDNLIRSRIILKKYLKETFQCSVQISDEQLLNFYEEQKEIFINCPEVRASHILISGTGEDSLQKCKEILVKLSSPEDFIRLSAEYSDCPSNCNCGDLGFFPRGKLIKEIEDQAFSLEVNQISDPFLTSYGYHILMVTEKREGGIIPFEDIKPLLRARLLQIEMDFALVKLVKKLREQGAKAIQILDPDYL